MTFIAMVITSVLIGWFAQAKKGRTGAIWGFITMLVLIPTWLVIYFATAVADRSLYKSGEDWWTLAIVVCVGTGIVMVLIVATLPKKRAAE